MSAHCHGTRGHFHSDCGYPIRQESVSAGVRTCNDGYQVAKLARSMVIVLGLISLCLAIYSSTTLVSLLLTGHAAVTQFFPGVVLGLYWKRVATSASVCENIGVKSLNQYGRKKREVQHAAGRRHLPYGAENLVELYVADHGFMVAIRLSSAHRNYNFLGYATSTPGTTRRTTRRVFKVRGVAFIYSPHCYSPNLRYPLDAQGALVGFSTTSCH